jgi:SPP1 family predicted phage head-tail adaptor
MAYESGTLNQRVTVRRKLISRDALGAEVVTWFDLRTVWAAKHPIRGKEYLAADHLRASLECIFVLRANAGNGITEQDILIHKGQIFSIASPPIDIRSKGHWMELMCSAGVAKS